ncbi:unnamed protein product [Leptosia nina]|uniref:Uncharacterized protein n=1 Tax=Leptosia nina TaxID=320188 RepID=A0AAV1JTB2_9NEOP
MRFVLLLLAFGFIVNATFGRPSQGADRERDDEAEYEEKEDSAAGDYLNNDPPDKISQEADSSRYENEEESIEGSQDYPKHSSATNNERGNVEDKLESSKSDIFNQANEEDMPLSEQHQSNAGNDETEDDSIRYQQTLLKTRLNALKRQEEKADDVELGLNDRNAIHDRHIIKDRGEYSNDAIEAPEEPVYKHIRYYNQIQGNVFQKRKPNNINTNRDRREISNDHVEKDITNDKNNAFKKDEAESTKEDNVSAIKRNIKKLSREELEDLLNSLSEDKKALLNKIIGNKIASDSVNKREITKKAGAVEDNNCMDGGQSDFNKMDSLQSMDSISSVSQHMDTTETMRQTDGSGVSKTKNSESDSTSSKSEGKDELVDENLRLNPDSGQGVTAQILETKENVGRDSLKSENKRETNMDDVPQDKSESNNEPSEYSHYDNLYKDVNWDKDDNWSELMKDETELHQSYNNQHKRDLDYYANSADVKSLEDSFPNYESVDSKSPGSQMAPLVRVKRTNSNIVKRAPGHCSDMKVPFFPGAINDDADDNEKDEFDDGAVFENSYSHEKVGKEKQVSNNEVGPVLRNRPKITSCDMANIGSDTDNILSNIEEVDNNLMYNNNAIRKKRFSNDANLNNEDNSLPETVLPNNEDYVSDLSLKNNKVHYQENDAFGAIPHSENELSRSKRIRRLKKAPSTHGDLQE